MKIDVRNGYVATDGFWTHVRAPLFVVDDWPVMCPRPIQDYEPFVPEIEDITGQNPVAVRSRLAYWAAEGLNYYHQFKDSGVAELFLPYNCIYYDFVMSSSMANRKPRTRLEAEYLDALSKLEGFELLD